MDWLEVLNTVFVLIVNLLTVWNIWMILNILFGCDLRLSKRNMLLTGGIFLIFNVVLSFFYFHQEERTGLAETALVFLFISLGAFGLAVQKRWKAFLFSFPALLLYIVYGQALEMLDVIFGLGNLGIVIENERITPFRSMTDILFFIILYWILRKCQRQKWSLTLTVGEGILVFIFCLFLYYFRYIIDNFFTADSAPFYRIVCYIFLMMLYFGLIYSIIHRKLAGYYKKESLNYKEQFEEEYSYFQLYKKKQKDTSQFRHDWQNHMLVLQKMLQEGDYGKAEEYFESLSGMTSLSRQTILTGNEMLDMLLCIKEAVCAREGIRISMDGTLSALPALHPVDSSILFSNLLDNAIEANQKVETDRFIHIRARLVNESVYLEMENPMKNGLQYDGTQLVTTKADSDSHGLGLKNVTEIIQKYKGQYHIDGKENIFTIQIIFPSAS